MPRKNPSGDSEQFDDAEEIEVTDAQPVAPANEGLIKMHLNGVDLHVHPTTVQSHEKAGWKKA